MVLTEPYTWLAALLLGWVLLVGLPLAPRGSDPPSAVGAGFLRRGAPGAILTALTLLYADGLVAVSGRGLLTRSREPMRSGVDPFAAAVYAAMPAPTGVRTLRTRSRVRTGLATLTRRLASAGLVPGRGRWWLARGILFGIAVVAGYLVIAADRSWPLRLPYLVVLLVAVTAWLARRSTVAGYRVLRAQRREHAGLLRSSPAGAEREQRSPEAVAIGYVLGGVLPPGLAAARKHGRRLLGDATQDRSAFETTPYNPSG